MDHAGFWATLAARSVEPSFAGREAPPNGGAVSIAQLPKAELVEFNEWFSAYHSALRREDLWAAVSAIRGGCGDDSFDYFRAWLIGQGEKAVLAAIQDPEALIEIVGTRDPRDEALLGAARRAYGRDVPDGPRKQIPGRDAWPADRFLSGLEWDRDFYAARFPKLYAKYFADLPPEPTGSISHERFWQLIEQSKQQLGALETILVALPLEELIGFDRWLGTYNQELMRDDLRAVSRIVLGADDGETFAGFRGWLLLQGEAAVRAATRDADSVLEHARQPLAPCRPLIFVTWPPLERKGVYTHGASAKREVIPDRAEWSVDRKLPREPGPLRERFPKLTRDRSDAQLTGAVDVSQFSPVDRQAYATSLFDRAKKLSGDAERIAQLDLVIAAMPTFDGVHTARAKSYARLGNHAAAVKDFDVALALKPAAVLVQWERSKSRLALGDKAGALGDARAAADQIVEARAWLTSQESGVPKRVRHPKFGEGKVVSASAGNLTIDFASGRKTIAARFVEVLS